MSFNLDEYVDVAERVHSFYERFEDGRLVTVDFGPMAIGGKEFVFCHARAFRSPDDPLPGDGIAWEPVPGPTQFTKDSELMNAQTAAWGRAIVALGFDTKKIASRQEVAARQSAASPPAVGERPSSGPGEPAPASAFSPPPGAVGDGHGFNESHGGNLSQEDRNREAAARVKVHFGKNVDKALGELTQKQVAWYAGDGWLDTTAKALDEGKKKEVTSKDRQLRQAARCYLAIEPIFETVGPFNPDDDLPF